MAKSKAKRKRTPKYVLKLPDLEQSKSAVLNSLTSRSSQRTYDHAIRQFIEWYYSEPRLAFNKTVVTRYRISLGQRRYASTTINLRLAAVRRLAYEAADCGLLSADLAAGIHRVKGAKRLGVRVGNWLSAEQGRRLLVTTDGTSLRGKRDYATLAILLGCGLRGAELTALRVEDIQQREEHWVIADLVGKGGHIRTIPVSDWVKAGIDAWMTAAGIATGTIFRAINKAGRIWGTGFSPKVIWGVVKKKAKDCEIPSLAPHDLRRTGCCPLFLVFTTLHNESNAPLICSALAQEQGPLLGRISPQHATSVGAHVDPAEDARVTGDLLDPCVSVLRIVNALPGRAIVQRAVDAASAPLFRSGRRSFGSACDHTRQIDCR